MRRILLMFITLSLISVSQLYGQSEQKKEGKSAFEFGIRAGMTAADVNANVARADRTSARLGYYGGLTARYNLTRKWFVESGVDFKVKGYKQRQDKGYNEEWARTSYRANPMYIQVPVQFGYRLQTQPISMSFSGGAYVAYGVAGKLKTSDPEALLKDENGRLVLDENGKTMLRGTVSENFFGKKSKHIRFDAGLTFKIEAEYEAYAMHIGYDLGLANVARKDGLSNNRTKMRNRNMYVGLGYRF